MIVVGVFGVEQMIDFLQEPSLDPQPRSLSKKSHPEILEASLHESWAEGNFIVVSCSLLFHTSIVAASLSATLASAASTATSTSATASATAISTGSA